MILKRLWSICCVPNIRLAVFRGSGDTYYGVRLKKKSFFPKWGMGKKTDKFMLLMWKNWKLQIRHPVQTLFEILVPVFFCAILVLVRSLVEVDSEPETIYPSFNLSFPCGDIKELAFSPNGSLVAEVVRRMDTKIPVVGFDSHYRLETYLINENSRDKVGLVFDDSLLDAETLPKKTNFTLRFPSELHKTNPMFIENWRTNLLFPLLQTPGPRDLHENFTAAPWYYQEGFLYLQHRISKAILEMQFNDRNKSEDLPKIRLRRFPYPPFISDPLLPVLEQMLGLLIVLAFVYTSISTIKIITAEKEKQLKESMKIMGLPGWLHWTAWFMKSLLFMLISITIMVILFKTNFYQENVGAVFKKCDGSIMFLFLLLYVCANITFCFAVSVFFSKANLASGIGGVMFFLFFVPFSINQNKYQYLSGSTKLLSSLMANTAMGYGFRLICMYESTNEGLQWSNMWKTVTPDDNIVMGEIMLMLFLDSILYMLITLYVEAIFPGKYGVPKKWNFIFTWLFPSHTKITGLNSAMNNIRQDPSTYEDEPQLKKGIEIKHLRKVYPGKKVAVRDFSLNMFENQITVLLGHNGAGKTTTMSMLTGMFPPTSGNAIINGYDICNQIDQVRSSLGLCPQHNILFDELSVEEHIYFYSRLKGMPGYKIRNEINSYVKLLELEDKRHNKSVTLSGGMKRKLSVAVAFCGDSKVVMLDEPTAGMDPAARRALWEMVQKQKQGRTVMLTTHFMDEADILGDRIAIMADGELQCCGSSFFLKKKYGAGYYLIMDKNMNCNVDKVTDILSAHIPGIKVQSNIGSELTYLLNEADSAVFQDMLKDLEVRSKELGIRSYGISLTTLEEVFMKVGAEDHIRSKGRSNEAFLESDETMESQKDPSDTQIALGNNLLTGYKLRRNQFIAMLIKRSLTTIRSWQLLLLQLTIPMLLLVFAIKAARGSLMVDLPGMKVTLDVYRTPVVPVSTTRLIDNTFIKAQDYIKQKLNAEVKNFGTSGMIPGMLKLTKDEPSQVRMHYIVGGHFNETEVIGYFNNDPFHSPPLALNFIMNVLLVSKLGMDYEINVYNQPMPFLLNSRFEAMAQTNNMGFQLAFNIGFCMAFISAFYVLFYIKERICKVKHLQFVSGVNILIFWSASFLWDWFTYIVTITLLIITLICFQEDGFKTWEDIGHLIVIFLFFGFSMLPLIYVISFVFKMPSSGFIRVILFTMLLGTFGFMVVEILSIKIFNLSYLADALDWTFIFVPHYSLSTAIKYVNMEYQRFAFCQKMVEKCLESPRKIPEAFCWTMLCRLQDQCCEQTASYYKWEKPGILRNVVISTTVGIVLITFLFLKEYKIFSQIKYRLMSNNRTSQNFAEDDSDVVEENDKIRRMKPGEIRQYSLVLSNVTKYYKSFQAVNQVCLGVRGYECFGLLGVNGAGKTSTFRMMTGDTSISSGDIYVNGLNLKSQMKEVNKQIGYCPQFDALLDDLTARETIVLFAILRGFTKTDALYLAEKLAKNFDFHKHLDKMVRNLSGGNKRKLSTAVALVGDPPLLFFDEPTTGMDPATKRYLWDALCTVRDSGKCLILTSHSMEECEALCTRLAIMVNGRFQCIGSTQHLKNKFSKGYTLTIKLRKRPENALATNMSSMDVVRYIKETFRMAIVREQHQELISFYLETDLPWSTLFGYMESAKKELDIEDYSIGQSSLEQVFLSFTKNQNTDFV